MSDIQNPISGRTFKQVDNTLAEILVDAGIMVYCRASAGAANAPILPKKNTFIVGRNTFGKLCIIFTTPTGAATLFAGEPSKARDAFKALAWSAEANARVLSGPEVPAHVIAEYTAQHQHEDAASAATNKRITSARNTPLGTAEQD